eukprot:2342151-Rhodomonas_salina.1
MSRLVRSQLGHRSLEVEAEKTGQLSTYQPTSWLCDARDCHRIWWCQATSFLFNARYCHSIWWCQPTSLLRAVRYCHSVGWGKLLAMRLTWWMGPVAIRNEDYPRAKQLKVQLEIN